MEQERLPYELLGGWSDACGCKPALEARGRITELRAEGFGSRQIARRLNMEGYLTPSHRGRWHAETVERHEHPERWAAYMRDYRARRMR